VIFLVSKSCLTAVQILKECAIPPNVLHTSMYAIAHDNYYKPPPALVPQVVKNWDEKPGYETSWHNFHTRFHWSTHEALMVSLLRVFCLAMYVSLIILQKYSGIPDACISNI